MKKGIILVALIILCISCGRNNKTVSDSQSGVEKSIGNTETSTKFNQVELFKQWFGTWKSEIAKDSTGLWIATPYGTGLEGIYKFSSAGNTYMEGKEFAGYDKNLDKYIAAIMVKGKDIELYAGWFTAKNKCIQIPHSYMSNPLDAPLRTESTFVSPDVEIDTIFVNNKPVKTQTWTRVN